MIALSENAYNAGLRRNEPKLKVWRYAGLMLTYRCTAACRFCYYACSPRSSAAVMPVETALEAWRSLVELAGPQANLHITGGEPFLEFDHLVNILDEARRRGLPALNSLETNGSWAVSESETRRRLAVLKSMDLQELKISYDPFHAEFVEHETIVNLERLAGEVLGPQRVRVKWRKYLDAPVPYDRCLPADQKEFCREILREDRCRFTGRAAIRIDPLLAERPLGEFTRFTCRNAILGARGVHIDPFGNVFSGQCSGIIAGNLNSVSLEQLWRTFDPPRLPFWGTLFRRGPAGLIEEAAARGYPEDRRYASKCHLCSDIRRFFFDKDRYLSIIGPSDCYSQ